LPWLLLMLAGKIAASLPAPVDADAYGVVLPPSAALRSGTAAELPSPPVAPRRVDLICSIRVEFGAPDECLPAETSLAGLDETEFTRAGRAFREDLRKAEADPIVRAALTRIMLMRLRADRPRTGETVLVRFSETIAARDLVPDPAPAERIDRESLQFEPLPPELTNSLFPVRALRNERQARVTMICRIGGDQRLQCRGGTVTMPGFRPEFDSPQAEAEMERDFLMASYQLSSLLRVAPTTIDGRQVAGRDVEYSVSWVIRTR
jgi:hypothetical protein